MGLVSSTELIGRSRDFEELSEVLERERLVTILGPPGIGKTRLAEHTLEMHLAAGAVGAMVDLTAATSVDGICRAVARALNVTIGDGDADAVVEQLGRAMASRGPMLMVLDNFEQVASCGATTVAVWLQLAPEAQLLVTSRERLSLRREILFDLGPLSVPGDGSDPREAGAVMLFVERAQAAWRGYRLVDAELPVVAAIVRRFEGNPLAIELAAARTPVFSSAEILASLDLDLSAGNAVDAPARHASLRQAIAWSWGLLERWEQDALAQCAVFQDGFGTLAAAEVMDLSPYPQAPPPLAVVEALYNKSLLRRCDAPEEPTRARFRLSVEVHEFAYEKLVQSGGDRGAEGRHARYFRREGRARADAIDGPLAAEGLRWLAVEMENLLIVHARAMRRESQTVETATEAADVALALYRFLRLRGPLRQLVSLIDGAIEAAKSPEVPAALRAEVLLAHGEACHLLLRGPEAEKSLESALSLARGADDQRLTGEISITLGWLRWRRAEDTESAFERALATGDRRVRARALRMLASLRRRQGRMAEAIDLIMESRSLCRELGAAVDEALAVISFSLVKCDLGQLDEACANIEPACEALESLGLRRHEEQSRATWGLYEHARGRLEAADLLLANALRAFREGGNSRWEGYCCVYLGTLYLSMGRFGAARAYAEQGCSLLGGSGVVDEALAHTTVAAADAAEGRLDEALTRFQAAEQRTYHDPSVVAVFWVMRGHLDLALTARSSEGSGAATKYEESARRRARCAPGATAPIGRDPAPPVWLGVDVRVAQVSLERALARHGGGPPREEQDAPVSTKSRASSAIEGALTISLAHGWLVPPGGKRTSLLRRPALARLLRRLSEQWLREPGVPLSIKALSKIGWPGEEMSEVAGRKRVYTAIWALRRQGLAEVLVQREGGYLFEPDAPIRIVGVSTDS